LLEKYLNTEGQKLFSYLISYIGSDKERLDKYYKDINGKSHDDVMKMYPELKGEKPAWTREHKIFLKEKLGSKRCELLKYYLMSNEVFEDSYYEEKALRGDEIVGDGKVGVITCVVKEKDRTLKMNFEYSMLDGVKLCKPQAAEKKLVEDKYIAAMQVTQERQIDFDYSEVDSAYHKRHFYPRYLDAKKILTKCDVAKKSRIFLPCEGLGPFVTALHELNYRSIFACDTEQVLVDELVKKGVNAVKNDAMDWVDDFEFEVDDLMIISHCLDYCPLLVKKMRSTKCELVVYEHRPFYVGMYDLYPSRECGYILSSSRQSIECGIVSNENNSRPYLRSDNFNPGVKIVACGGAALYYINHFRMYKMKVKFKCNNYTSETLEYLERENNLYYEGKPNFIVRFGNVEKDEILFDLSIPLLTAPICSRGSMTVLQSFEEQVCDPDNVDRWLVTGIPNSDYRYEDREFMTQLHQKNVFFLREDDIIVKGDATEVARIGGFRVFALRSKKVCVYKCSKCHKLHPKILGPNGSVVQLNVV